MAGELVKGIAGGAIGGANALSPFGPVGMGIGAGIGAISGALQGSGAQKAGDAYRRAENAIPMYDPAQQAYLARVRMQERAMRAGTDPSSALAQRVAGNVAAQTQANLLRAGGPGTANNLLRPQAALGNQVAQIGANAASGANQLLSDQGGLIDNMANRVYQRQRELRNQALARYEQQRKDINNQFMAGLGALPTIAATPGMRKMAPSTAPLTPTYNKGGMVGDTYVPGVTTGVRYNGLGTGYSGGVNYGFGYNPPATPNYSLR